MSARAAWAAVCATVLLCACTQPRPDSEWHLLIDSGDISDVYVSRTRLQPLGTDMYRVWLREDWPESLVSEPGSRVKVAVEDFDCRGQKNRVIVPAVPEKDLREVEGELLRIADQQPWEEVGVNTGTQQIMDALCRYAREARAG